MTQPGWLAPMLATLSYEHFSDPNWIFERKLDGMRCLLHKKGSKITILSRNNVNQNKVFPELVAALAKYKGDFILDSEVVAFVGKQISFEKLQERMHVKDPSPQLIKQVPVIAYVFDVLFINKQDVCNLPLMARKQILKENFKFKAPLRLLNYKKQFGEKFLLAACKAGWEGLIAKHAPSTGIKTKVIILVL